MFVRLVLVLALVCSLFACGGSSDDEVTASASDASITDAPAQATNDGGAATGSAFAIGGSVTGLVGDLELRNNGGDAVTLHGDGPFVFPTRLSAGSTFLVGVEKAPADELCVVTNGQGTVTGDVTDVTVQCSDSRSELASLDVMQGTVAARMTPAFAADVTSYVAELHAISAPSVDVILTPVSSSAVVVVDGKQVDPSTPISYPVLEVGARTIDIVVSSASGSSQSHYRVGLGAVARYFKPDGVLRSVTGFGSGIAATTDRLFVGAANESNGTSTSVGAVTIYQRAGGIWTEETKLLPPATMTGDHFGTTLAFDVDTLVVGTTGAAPLVYRLGATGWALEQDLGPIRGDGVVATGALAIEGDRVVSGGLNEDGPIFVSFVRTGTTWQEDGAIPPARGLPDGWGSTFAISQGLVFIGVPSTTDDTMNGVVDIWQRKKVGTFLTWVHTPTPLAPPDGDLAPGFGSSLAVSGSTVIVGAPDEGSFGAGVDPPASANTAPGSGAVYAFTADLSNSTLLHKLKAPVVPTTGLPPVEFGSSVAFDGARLLVGAIGDLTQGSGFGAPEGVFDSTAESHGTVRLYTVDATFAITAVAAIRSPNPICAARFGTNMTLTPDGFAIVDGAEFCSGSGIEPDPSTPAAGQLSGAVYDYVLP